MEKLINKKESDNKPSLQKAYDEIEELRKEINSQIEKYLEKYPEVEIKEGYPFDLKCHFIVSRFSL